MPDHYYRSQCRGRALSPHLAVRFLFILPDVFRHPTRQHIRGDVFRLLV